MKNDIIYPFYITYLHFRLNENKISKGAFSLLKMSSEPFENFKFKYENDENFRNKILDMRKANLRDQKIDDIFKDDLES